ncbi:DNA-binding transcriptional regulator, LysR family [Formivibrio citricus]|uniref:DNA-binding transcriptional regulator, LysR family n=1 Tax=Formivibrio citricus TaxID=83765 RepID=A0A1I5DYI9_9NEIS|nr:LysR family transcriptional regulator [Formivibrio citricus]SFO04262.1 DNA-binding transcriptional regulator, LysR family [Formivibrio citricus]
MDDKDWRILKTVAEERNITKAAARLFTTQPALTYRLKSMEEEIGAQIVFRVPSGVVFTPQGEYLLAYATEMVQRFDKVKEYIKNMENKVQGALRMGSSAVFAHYSLPSMLKGFLAQYPEVEFSLKTGLSYQVLRMLEKQEIVLGVVRGEHAWDGDKLLLGEEPICLVSMENLEFDDLLRKPHIRYNTDPTLQKDIDDWWRHHFKKPPNTTMEVNTMDTARQLALNGLGWTILPAIGLPKNDALFVKPLSWRNGAPMVRKTWLLCADGAMELLTVRAFIDYLRTQQLIPG